MDIWASQVELVVKNPPAKVGDASDIGLIPGVGRSSGEGSVNPLQYPFLRNLMGRRARRAVVPGFTKSWTGLLSYSAHGYLNC